MTGKKSESIGLDTDAIMKRLFSISGARNERELADVLGVTRATLNYAKLREALPYKHIVKAALLYGRSVDWILWGEESSGAFVAVPMYEARLSADGRLEPCASAKRYAFRAEWLSALCRHNRPQDLGLMRVSGDSMLPAINDGDAVLWISPKPRAAPARYTRWPSKGWCTSGELIPCRVKSSFKRQMPNLCASIPTTPASRSWDAACGSAGNCDLATNLQPNE